MSKAINVRITKANDNKWYAPIVNGLMSNVIVENGFYFICNEFTNGSRCYIDCNDFVETKEDATTFSFRYDVYHNLAKCFHN